MKIYPMVRNPFARLDYCTTDQELHQGPCIVFNVVVTGAGGAGLVAVHDGDNVVSPIKLNLGALNNTSMSYNPPYGVIFDRGIFVNVAANMQASVLWCPLPQDYRKSMLVESVKVELGEKQMHPMVAHKDAEGLTHRKFEQHGPGVH